MPALWISSDGSYLDVRDKHITAMIANPEAFGTTKDEIVRVYRRFQEPVGCEGAARHQLILDAVMRGWIRVRLYPKSHCSITLSEANELGKQTIVGLMQAIIAGRVELGLLDPWIPVQCVFVVSGQGITVGTIRDVAEGHFSLDEAVSCSMC